MSFCRFVMVMMAMALLAFPGSVSLAADASTPAVSEAAVPAGDSTFSPPVAGPVAAEPDGLPALWLSGDWVAKTTVIVLVVMSVATWYILLVKLIEQVSLRRQMRDVRRLFSMDGPLQRRVISFSDGGVFRGLIVSVLTSRAGYREAVRDSISYNDWISLAVRRVVANTATKIQGGLAMLATIASTAPFVGLFGTVWGIHTALIAIGRSGQASLDKVAGPVGEALIMTTFGLAVAVPAVLAYNLLARRNKAMAHMVREFGADLHAAMLAEGRPDPKAG